MTAARPFSARPRRQTATSIALACGLAGCAGAPPSDIHAGDPRRPDGVAIDPIAELPDPVEVAPASVGVVALTTPLGSDAARATVRTFFEAVSREDLEALRSTLSPDATTINPSTRVRDRLEYVFMRRFQRLEYFALASAPFWQDDAMEVYRANEAKNLWSDSVGAAALPQLASTSGDALDGGDVVVRLAVTAPRSSGLPLMGDTMTFLLKRSGKGYVVHRLVEDFTLP